jgi:hypothetical protein
VRAERVHAALARWDESGAAARPAGQPRPVDFLPLFAAAPASTAPGERWA